MAPSAAPRLSDIAGPRLTLACSKCDRRGSYAVAGLIEKHGDISLIQFRELVSADCPRRRERRHGDWCGAAFEGLF